MNDEASGSLEVAVEDPGWASAATDIASVCEAAARNALALLPEALRDRVELCIVLDGDEAVRNLNRTWRGFDKATNVLSFPGLDTLDAAPPTGPVPLGDVVLAHPTVANEARAEGKTLEAHASHLVVHGVLHLMGFDHQTEAQAQAMEALERRLVTGLGHADPYAEEAV